MLNQAAHDIYNAAAEKTKFTSDLFGNEDTKYILVNALENAKFWLGVEEKPQFDIWIKAVEDLTAIHRAERK